MLTTGRDDAPRSRELQRVFREIIMPNGCRLVLTSFQDGRAVIEVAYSNRNGRLELDRLEDLYPGQPTSERAKEEVRHLADALNAWLTDPESIVEMSEL